MAFIHIEIDDENGRANVNSDMALDYALASLEKAKFQILSAYMPLPEGGYLNND